MAVVPMLMKAPRTMMMTMANESILDEFDGATKNVEFSLWNGWLEPCVPNWMMARHGVLYCSIGTKKLGRR